ncbi:MAG: DUF3108 domain-containing protein [Chitinivibrionia bacterium]|nr:DUF3108 domain-containing protein [Chitinivibrionia bacterium]
MRLRNNTSTAVASAIFIFSVVFCAIAQDDDDFKWQDAAKEVDSLPFSQTFIDSVKKEHIGGVSQRGLRQINARRISGTETLVYEVRWGVIKAGYVILTVANMRENGLIKLGAKSMTSNFISAFYKSRDYLISYVDADGLYPIFFEQHVREGNKGDKYKLDAYIVYNHKIGKLFVKKRELKEHVSPPFTHDYLSILYYTRTMPLNPGDVFTADLFASTKTDPVKVTVHDKREIVKVGVGTFNCVLVEPTFIGENKAFNKKSKIEAWVSDDEHKYPVMVKSKAKVGSVNAKLVMITK